MTVYLLPSNGGLNGPNYRVFVGTLHRMRESGHYYHSEDSYAVPEELGQIIGRVIRRPEGYLSAITINEMKNEGASET